MFSGLASLGGAPLIRSLQEAGYAVYLVGGSVRDAVLNLPVKDVDLLVTGVPLPRLKEHLARLGKVNEVGRSFGIVQVRPFDEKVTYEVALPRSEVSTGPSYRDFSVTFDPDLPVEKDLARRDFTMNAMAYDPQSGVLIDLFGGQRDLQRRVLRAVFDRAFEEDPLRILRGVQFAARLGLTIEAQTKEAMRLSAPRVVYLPAERVVRELEKMLGAPKPSVAFTLMRELGVLEHVLPELVPMTGCEQPLPFHDKDVFDHTMAVLDAARSDRELLYPGDLELLLAALLHDVAKPQTAAFNAEKGRITFYEHDKVGAQMTRGLMERLRLTMLPCNPQHVETLVAQHMFQLGPGDSGKAVRRFIARVGRDLALKQIDLRLADVRGSATPENIGHVLALRERVRGELEARAPLSVTDLAVSGDDLLALGFTQGPQIGRALAKLLEAVIDDPSANTREQLLTRARHLL